MSQNCDNKLYGKVTDLHDGSILIGVNLVIAGTEQSTVTDINGEFTINNLCNENYFVQVSHENCLTKVFKVKIVGNTTKNFKLEHHLEELNEILVQGNSTKIESKTIAQNSISKKELEQYSSGSLGDALHSFSGVSSLNTGNTVVKPIINGLHSSRIVIINNGVRMQDQEWGTEHAPNIDVNSIHKLTLVKGASALQYSGDAVGGLIIAEKAKIAVKDSIYGKTLLTGASNGRGGSFTTQLTKSYQNGWYGTLQGTLKRFGDFEAPDYVLSNTGIFERNASINIGLNRFNYSIDAYFSIFKNEIGILRTSHVGGAQDLVNAINNSTPQTIEPFTYNIVEPRQNVTHHLARVKAFKNLTNFGKLEVQYDFQRNNRFEYDIRRGDDKDKPSVDLELDTHTLKVDFKTSEIDKVKLKSGLITRYQNNFADPSTGVRKLIPDYDKYELGFYAVADYSLNNNLSLELGGRFDYTRLEAYKFYRTSFWEDRNYDVLYPEIVVERDDLISTLVYTEPQFNFNNLSATLGANYALNKTSKLFFNYSIASRAPNASELFSEGLHHSASRIELGDIGFKSEIGHKVSFTFQHQNKNFNFSVNPYLNAINNFIVIEPTGSQQSIRGEFQVWEYRQTNAKIMGFDLDASYAFTNNLSFNHQLSFVKGYDTTYNEPLINMPPVNTKNELVYLNKKWHNLKLKLQSEYQFEQNEYPNNNFEVYIPLTETYELVDISTPPCAYHLLNFNASVDFNLYKKSTLTVGLGITNLTNKSYRNYLNRLRYFADDLGRNLLINIKLNY